MKLFMTLVGMVAAGILGYYLEPDIRFQLTGEKPVEGKEAEPKRIVIDSGDTNKSKIDPATFPVEELPKRVLLISATDIEDEGSGLKMTIAAGSEVELIRLDGENVVVSPEAVSFECGIPISNTDLLEQLVALRADPDAMKKKVMPEPEVVVEAEPEPVGPIDVVEAMKGSIKAGEIKEFTFDQVTEWVEYEGEEEIDGLVYQTGVASYEGETVFGVKTLKAKALIKDGKLVRWVYEKSGLEIK